MFWQIQNLQMLNLSTAEPQDRNADLADSQFWIGPKKFQVAWIFWYILILKQESILRRSKGAKFASCDSNKN